MVIAHVLRLEYFLRQAVMERGLFFPPGDLLVPGRSNAASGRCLSNSFIRRNA